MTTTTECGFGRNPEHRAYDYRESTATQRRVDVATVRSGEPLHDIREAVTRRERSFAVPAPLGAVASPAAEPPVEASEEEAANADLNEDPPVA